MDIIFLIGYILQFLINVEADSDDIMISLSQPDTRADKNEANKTMGFHVMEVRDEFYLNFSLSECLD